jgi:CRP-like cAMP-binding protein
MATWMPVPLGGETPAGNGILASLPPHELDRIMSRMEERDVAVGDVLFEPATKLTHVYFPETAVVSLLTVLRDGSGIETATVGREGLVGVALFLGDDRSVSGRAVVQMPGRILRLDEHLFRAQLSEGGALPDLLLSYTRAMLLHLSQSTACGVAHPVRARLSRWLLQTSDRTESDDVPLSQQFLSELLGVRRATVTEAVGTLRSIGAIRSRRGGIEIIDRGTLEGTACECYALVRREYARLMPGD